MERIAVLIAVMMLLLSSGAGASEEREFKGYITDDMCGAEHMMEGMNDKECAHECVEMGALYALFVPDDETMYAVDDQERMKPFAGEKVVVTGSLSEDGKSITVVSVVKQE